MRYEVRDHPFHPDCSVVFDTYRHSAVVIPGSGNRAEEDWLLEREAAGLAQRLNMAYQEWHPERLTKS